MNDEPALNAPVDGQQEDRAIESVNDGEEDTNLHLAPSQHLE